MKKRPIYIWEAELISNELHHLGQQGPYFRAFLNDVKKSTLTAGIYDILDSLSYTYGISEQGYKISDANILTENDPTRFGHIYMGVRQYI